MKIYFNKATDFDGAKIVIVAFKRIATVYLRGDVLDELLNGQEVSSGVSSRDHSLYSKSLIDRLLEEGGVELQGDALTNMFTNGYYFLSKAWDILTDHISYFNRRRFNDLMRLKYTRLLNKDSDKRYITFKERRFNIVDRWELTRYEMYRDSIARLNPVIKQLLSNKTEDIDTVVNKFEEIFMDCYEYDNDRFSTVFDKISSVLENKGISTSLERASTCGHVARRDDLHTGLGRRYRDEVCNACFEDDYVYIEDEDQHWNRNNEEYFEHNDGSFYSYPEDDNDEDCDEDNHCDPTHLLDYSTNVTRILLSDSKIVSSAHGDFLMGIEFEMTSGDDMRVRDAVVDVRAQLGENYCVCKSDGSLPSNGLEIVTAPRGLTEHIKRFKSWQINDSYRAWDVGNCGMHIHIHSHAFTPLTFGKFVMLINSEENMQFVRKIAGRHPLKDRQAQQYCQVEGREILQNPAKASKGKSSDRYYMINTQNLSSSEARRLQIRDNTYVNGKDYDTVELRIFRSSLKKERLLAQIEFAHACVMFCRVASWRELDKMHFIEWLKTTNNVYPHLADWYGVRRRAKKQESLIEPSHHAIENTCSEQPQSI